MLTRSEIAAVGEEVEADLKHNLSVKVVWSTSRSTVAHGRIDPLSCDEDCVSDEEHALEVVLEPLRSVETPRFD